MKKARRFARLIFPLLTFTCLLPTIVDAAPYGPKGREIQWIQPGGQKLKLRVFGDEFYARTETLDGYTVVYNDADKAYYYAELGGGGNALRPTGRKAHLPPGGVKKGLDLPIERIGEIRTKNYKKLAGQRGERWNKRVQALRQLRADRLQGRNLRSAPPIQAAPVNGARKGLTILVQFPDDSRTNGKDPVDFPVSRAKIIRFCNLDGYNENGNTGSVRDYYYDQSNGSVEYTQKVTPIVTLPHPRNYYNYANYPNNSVLQDTGIAGNQIIQDAVAELQSSGYDFSNLTTDADGNAIATNIFFAGEDSGVWARGLWPHQSYLETPIPVAGGSITLNGYQITNIEDSKPTIGTFCHENGHLLCDFPDLYSYIDNGSVGYHCLMSAGNYNNDGKTPAPIDAYLKDTVGWANIEDITPSDYVTRTLPSAGGVAVRIRNPNVATESFVVENRGDGDRWAKYAPDKGIMIWHIDETVEGNANWSGEDPHFGVALMQADGRLDLEVGVNNGDGGDLFGKGDLFAATTRPNSDWWDGSNGNVRVKVLSNPSSAMKVQFGPLPPDTIIVNSPKSGDILYRGSKVRVKWEANVVGDLRIDLFRNGVFDSNIVKSTANNGLYVWEVPDKQDAGRDYSVRISTLTNPKPVFDDSPGNFMVTNSTFPEGGKMPYGWHAPKEADSKWTVTKSRVFEGAYSLKTKNTPDGGTCAIAYKSDFQAGDVSFYLKVSSEVNYDSARFYIDGVPQKLGGSSTRLSGVRDWEFVSVPLKAGTHTLMWTYEKDDSYGDGKDTAWLDAVLLPPTTQEIAVRTSSGKDLSSKSSQLRFGTTKMGRTSKAKKFTIKNTGKADLHGLKLKVTGKDKGWFRAGGLRTKVLKPGQSTTFQVRFAPKGEGQAQAEVRVRSNDGDEDPFALKVVGKGKGLPKLAVFQPEDDRLRDGKETLNFGFAPVGSKGRTRTFTIRNRGSEPLRIHSIVKKGSASRDFKVDEPSESVIAPGRSGSFRVTFQPKKKNRRLAKLVIRTNDKEAGPFTVELKGKGAPRRRSSSPLASLVADSSRTAASAAGADVSVMFVDGVKYRTLTVDKESVPSNLKPVVEVSGNLVDWFRGARHTTVVEDNAAILKVRDNTPLEPGVKRHIRLRTLER